jgi:hypothetical protein
LVGGARTAFYSKPQGNTTMPGRPLPAEGLVQLYDTGDIRALLAVCIRKKAWRLVDFMVQELK